MLVQFLRASTIHGLQYLASAPGTFAKIAWFHCVAASAVTASYFIYLNVRGWVDSPIVVSSVAPTLVEVCYTLKPIAIDSDMNFPPEQDLDANADRLPSHPRHWQPPLWAVGEVPREHIGRIDPGPGWYHLSHGPAQEREGQNDEGTELLEQEPLLLL